MVQNTDSVTIDDIAVDLFSKGCVKFGSFTLKDGQTSPIYFDFRSICSFPALLTHVAEHMKEMLDGHQFDLICGVPYGALSIASLLSVKMNKPMIFKRKEIKEYGTKKLIEGVFEKGQKVLIVEDVVTSGNSILETVNDLQKVGLNVSEAIYILDRMQGGVENLRRNEINAIPMFTSQTCLDTLMGRNLISEAISNETLMYLNKNQSVLKAIPRPSFDDISKKLSGVSKRLIDTMLSKQSNLIFSADLTDPVKLLSVVDRLGKYVCCVKLHINAMSSLPNNFIKDLKDLSSRDNFLLMEDAKFCDIGSTVEKQFTSRVTKISEWADLVTVHGIAGSGALEAIHKVNPNVGIILISQMSCEGNLIDDTYSSRVVQLGRRFENVVCGYVGQTKFWEQSADEKYWLLMTPGVALNSGGDSLGQRYRTIESAIRPLNASHRGSDLVIMGRAIYTAENPEETAQLCQLAAWRARTT